mmetsp:Transcript_17125/g.29406  ORF Transcript_17125/g.29406 Transcript_17125/m.29406 type:complete len:99 (+) Transcript_17125:2380-2676(+)
MLKWQSVHCKYTERQAQAPRNHPGKQRPSTANGGKFIFELRQLVGCLQKWVHKRRPAKEKKTTRGCNNHRADGQPTTITVCPCALTTASLGWQDRLSI